MEFLRSIVMMMNLRFSVHWRSVATSAVIADLGGGLAFWKHDVAKVSLTFSPIPNSLPSPLPITPSRKLPLVETVYNKYNHSYSETKCSGKYPSPQLTHMHTDINTHISKWLLYSGQNDA